MRLQLLTAIVAGALLVGLSAANAQIFIPSTPGAVFSQDAVFNGNEIIGRDPDPLVRLQLKRDYKGSGGGD